MRKLTALGLVLALTGCVGLALSPEDSGRMKAAKIATRIPLGLVTLGLSELDISLALERLEEERYVAGLRERIQNAREQILTAETEKEQRYWLLVHDDAANELNRYLTGRREAALAALTIWSARRQQVTQPRRSVHCTSQVLLGTIHTDCY